MNDGTGKLQAVVVRTSSFDTLIVLGHDLIVEKQDGTSDTYADGIECGLEAAGIEVLRP